MLTRLVLIALAFAFLPPSAESQQPPEAPKVETQQQPEGRVQPEQQPDRQTDRAAEPPATRPHIVALPGNKESQGDHDENNEKGTEFWPLNGYRLKITDTLLVVFTFGLFVATWLLWRATKRLVRDAQKTAAQQLRAYIAVGSHGIKPFRAYSDSATTESMAHIAVRNVGQVPARDVRWFIDIGLSGDGTRKHLPIGGAFFGENVVIQPGTEMVRSQRIKLSQTDISNFNSHRAFLYVWGKICYMDGFGVPRFTLFCHRYERTGFEQGVAVDAIHIPEITAESMRYHQYGNDAN